MVVLTTGAYSRQQFADRLGISVHTFDKTLRRLRTIIGAVSPNKTDSQEKDIAGALRYSYYDSTDPILLFLFRAKSLKESETLRLSLVLTALNEQALTAMEILDTCCRDLPPDAPSLPDEKTIRTDLKYLEEVGVIKKVSGARPYRYRIHNDLVQALTADELEELYDFVDIMANTQVPSVQGFLLRDGLKKRLNHSDSRMKLDASEPFLYKYHYHSRILDEAHLQPLLKAIQERRNIQFHYLSPKNPQSYMSKNTNPLYERKIEGKAETALPLKIVYDHQYGRWYLIANEARLGMKKYRMEGISQIEEAEPVGAEHYQEQLLHLDRLLHNSWLIDTSRQVTVRVRFFNPGRNQSNFIKERVLLQGQWGVIVEENEESFLFEIEVNGTTEIKPWIRSFGSSCEVLEPKQLRMEMIEEWKEILAYYEPVRENI
jgi:predicted DNA-binding transcriptional regulator YafY